MRPKSIMLLMLALGCGLTAAVGINQVMARRDAQPVAVGARDGILVAAGDIGLGTVLTADLVKLEAWPEDRVPRGALVDIEDVEERRTRTKLYAGEPILTAKLTLPGALGGEPALQIPPGHRMVSVKVDSVSGASSLIQPGDRVDVMVHLRGGTPDVPQTSTRTVLRDIKVFAVNAIFQPSYTGDDEKTAIQAKTISLLVDPEQAELLTLASQMGQIRLSLRNPEDKNVDGGTGKVAFDVLRPDREGGHREESVEADTPVADNHGPFDFLSMLNGSPSGNDDQTGDEPTSLDVATEVEPDWRMVVLRGPEAEELEFFDGERLPRSSLGPSPGNNVINDDAVSNDADGNDADGDLASPTDEAGDGLDEDGQPQLVPDPSESQ